MSQIISKDKVGFPNDHNLWATLCQELEPQTYCISSDSRLTYQFGTPEGSLSVRPRLVASWSMISRLLVGLRGPAELIFNPKWSSACFSLLHEVPGKSNRHCLKPRLPWICLSRLFCPYQKGRLCPGDFRCPYPCSLPGVFPRAKHGGNDLVLREVGILNEW